MTLFAQKCIMFFRCLVCRFIATFTSVEHIWYPCDEIKPDVKLNEHPQSKGGKENDS